ncbi:Golgi membrane protein 1 [Periophthalmus magnuspinnatus]|uniref:Golgi membrane protein 1 n=1 Tax=Periophthalmus magnuspinnatus TaxID=409849 RepID=UPI00145BD8C9|nr:Golgi membrane protein 1 [Periophthalmus magnuspinnatus]
MGGLGNGRRGGRSPPLLIAALIACILVLGFNYWVSSSRNLELQTKLYELEGQVRRGAAERGVAEMKKTEFQEEIQRQREQISHIENLYKKQLEGAQSTCSQERVVLQQNISSSTKTIQELKGQLNQLNDDVGQLQKELQSCQGSIKTLNNKLTYDMTHCNSQVLSQKELCDERVAATKLEAQKKMEKLIASLQANTPDVEIKVSNETTKTVDYIVNPSQPRDQPSELLSNSILETKDVTATNTSDQGLLKQDPLAIPTAAAVKKDLLPPPEGAEATKPLETNTTDDKEMELMDTKDESHTDDPGMEDMLLTDDKADDPAHKVDLQDEYDTDDQEVVPEKQKASKHENLDQEEEDLADYNGDNDNEGEFEADKQAALAQI